MSRRYRHRYQSYWPEYVPVAERRARAERQMKKLAKKGETVQPVVIEGRTIARTFWGKGWCDHLEDFGDYSNRLPRGRSYVRNGSVCHLAIERGRVRARVAGSSLYSVMVTIAPLPAAKWEALKKRCAGRIGSLIELLQGRLADEIMSAVTDRAEGLFPLPGEIEYTCDCPDWAGMCKHVSAVMYGIGARLDAQPELLFLLRGVDHNELVTGAADAAAMATTGSRRSRRRTLAEKDLGAVFGVELEAERAAAGSAAATPSGQEASRPVKTGKDSPAANKRAVKAVRRKPVRVKGAKSPSAIRSAPFKPTAEAVARMRAQLGMSVAAFARAVGVSPVAVSNWERSQGPLRLHVRSLAGLQRIYRGRR